MAAKKDKKNGEGNFQHFWTPSNQIGNKILESLDSPRRYGIKLENPKTEL